MELNELEQQRVEKLQRLREAGESPYPRRITRTHTLAEAAEVFEAAETADVEPPEATVVGRLISIRVMGKIAFAHIEDAHGKIQLFLRHNEMAPESYNLFKKAFDLGDFVEATGPLMRTRTGEISVLVKHLRMLSKAISPLPVIPKEKEVDGETVRYTDFSDVEERYRQRYADLASNPNVRAVFRKRARTVKAMRDFLDDHGFLEVETPILQPIYGGAAAHPFVTHHQQLHQDLYLRISFELYLKRLLVGMYDRVYEIGRDFRNEGVSPKHNPEFTLLYQDHDIDLAPPWRRVSLQEVIQEGTGIDYRAFPEADALRQEMRARGYQADEHATWGHLVDNLLSEVEPTLIQPTFVHTYPVAISPLAKQCPDDPTHVERFELFIGGLELGNAFTELNDPFEQEERFLEQGRAYEAGDKEAQQMDEDYLRAMKYGMPPNGGFGLGVDRLVMLFTDCHSIREVLLYPHLRPRE